jgi:hypothetical protein
LVSRSSSQARDLSAKGGNECSRHFVG